MPHSQHTTASSLEGDLVWCRQMQVSQDEFRSFATHLSAAVDKVKEASSHVDNELAVIDWCITQNIDRAHTLISQISSYAAERFDIGGTASFIAPDFGATPQAWLQKICYWLDNGAYEDISQELSRLPVEEFAQWELRAVSVLEEVGTCTIPIFGSARRTLVTHIQTRVYEALISGCAQLARLYYARVNEPHLHIASWHRRMDHELRSMLLERQSQVPECDPSVHADAHTNNAPHYHPIASVGSLTLSTISGQRTGLHGEPDHQWNLTFNATEPRVCNWGLFLNFDHTGGFATTDVETVQFAVLDLLHRIPAGRVIVDAFDPEQLGDSLSFLFGLGPEGERIYGDTVRTNTKHLEQLLTQVEQHIAVVTQRCLQGQHHTITEYNKAAPEAAEPYRLLLLFDFPSGLNEELTRRVSRIAAVGRRAGVFVIVVSAQRPELLETLPWLPRNGTPVYSAPEGELPPHTMDSMGLEHDVLLEWTFRPGTAPTGQQLEVLLRGIRTQLQDSPPADHAPVSLADIDAARLVTADTHHQVALPVGTAVQTGVPLFAEVTRSVAANVVVAGVDNLHTLTAMLTSLVLNKVDTHLINFISANAQWEQLLEPLEEHGLTVQRAITLDSTVESFLKEARARAAEGRDAAPQFLVLAGVHRAKRLDPANRATTVSDMLHELLAIGPAVGVHTIMTADGLASAQSRVQECDWHEFGLQVLEASRTNDNQLLFEDHIHAFTQQVHGFAPSEPADIERLINTVMIHSGRK